MGVAWGVVGCGHRVGSGFLVEVDRVMHKVVDAQSTTGVYPSKWLILHHVSFISTFLKQKLQEKCPTGK